MTNAEFQKKLAAMYAGHPILTKGPKQTFNVLTYILRKDDVDYNISIPPYKEGMGWLCIPSVKDFFIPVRELAMHVKEVKLDECDNDAFGFDGICLTVWLED